MSTLARSLPVMVGVAVAQVAASTVRVNCRTAAGTLASGSVAVTVKVKVPVAVGLPVMADEGDGDPPSAPSLLTAAAGAIAPGPRQPGRPSAGALARGAVSGLSFEVARRRLHRRRVTRAALEEPQALLSLGG